MNIRPTKLDELITWLETNFSDGMGTIDVGADTLAKQLVNNFDIYTYTGPDVEKED